MPEAINSGMFQVPADDARHLDVFRFSRNAGPQAANSPDEQLYFHAGAGSFLELVDDVAFRQGIDFNKDCAFRPFCRFPLNQFKNSVFQLFGRDQQLLVASFQVGNEHRFKCASRETGAF